MTDTSIVQSGALGVTFNRGSIVALEGITVALADGVVGLVGANGAGKTTLLRCLSGALAPTAGGVSIAGVNAAKYRQTRAIGFIPAQPRFPAYLTVAQFIEGLRVVCGHPVETESEQLLTSEFELARLADRRMNTLSLGQARRVEVVAALIGDPDLVLFDEPTNGLDPIAMTQLRQGILAARRPGRCIIVSSHHLDELQRVATRVLFLREGRLDGDHTAEALASSGQTIEERFLSNDPRLDSDTRTQSEERGIA